MEIALKTCPWCNGRYFQINREDCYRVTCGHCGATTPARDSFVDAADDWNAHRFERRGVNTRDILL